MPKIEIKLEYLSHSNERVRQRAYGQYIFKETE